MLGQCGDTMDPRSQGVVPGAVFDLLMVVRGPFEERGALRVWTQCECGLGHNVRVTSLLSLKRTCFVCRNAVHGESGIFGRSKEYRTWTSIKHRCFRKNAVAFRHYGGRGITMCQRWRDSFDAFLADMGRSPSPKHSIDRVNNDGNYEPGNCRWATAKEQANNKRPRLRAA